MTLDIPMLESHIYRACLWEATARKAGNVHPNASFQDLTYADFVRSAAAIAPVLARAPDHSLGVTICDAIAETQKVAHSNTNLGIVLLLAPLAKVQGNLAACDAILQQATVEDTSHVYEAIRMANPGGMGKVKDQDLAEAPTLPLRAVMSLAADRDMVARQYANGFRDVFEFGVPALLDGYRELGSIEGAIVACQLAWLANFADSLILRKRGLQEALEVKQYARAIQALGLKTSAGKTAFAEWDGWLRAVGHTRNPGTTADLVTACLFVALCENKINALMPFPWND